MASSRTHAQVQSIYQHHHGWLRGWLCRRLGCSAQAADIAQDVFVRLLARPGLESVDEPRAYLTVVARGLMIEHWRRKDLERAWLELLAQVPEEHVPPPERHLACMEALVAIDRVLDGLKPRTREAFLLARLEGLTCPRIAERLGVSLATVERDIATALKHCYRMCFDA